MCNLRVKFQYLVTFLIFGALAFFDIANHLNIGRVDHDGFAPTNHGFLGTALKVVLVSVSAYFLVKLIYSLVKNKLMTAIIFIILSIVIYFGLALLAFSLYYRF